MDFRCLSDTLNEYSTIALSGGEPLGHPEFEQIIDLCAINFENTTILTNGRLLSDDLMNRFEDYGNIDIQMSLEGNADIQNKIRGKGTYNEVLCRMDDLRNHNIQRRCAMTVHKFNLQYMEDFLATCNDFEVFPTFHRYIPLGRGKSSIEIVSIKNLFTCLSYCYNFLVKDSKKNHH